MAYLAAVIAHPAFTARFRADLVQPGLRVPLTADAAVYGGGALGREVIWLHSFGERFAARRRAGPSRPPRLPNSQAPSIPAEGEIPEPRAIPDAISYDPAKRRLWVGDGYVDNVTPEVWAYEVSGKQVLGH